MTLIRKSSGASGWKRPFAPYAAQLLAHFDPPLRQRLREAGMDGREIKRTFDALFTRGYILVRQQQLGKHRVS